MGLFGRRITEEEIEKLNDYDSMKLYCKNQKEDFHAKWEEARDCKKQFYDLKSLTDEVQKELTNIKNKISTGVEKGILSPSQVRYIYGSKTENYTITDLPYELREVLNKMSKSMACAFPQNVLVPFGELRPGEVFKFRSGTFMKVEGCKSQHDKGDQNAVLIAVGPGMTTAYVGDHYYFSYKQQVAPKESSIVILEGESWTII